MVIIDLVRRLALKRLMRSGLVVEPQITLQPLMRRVDGVIRVQIDLLIFDTFPESLHENVIPPAAFAMHADLNAVVFQESRELLAGELAPLIRVEDLGAAILRDRLAHGVETEVRGQRIGEPPGQHPATGPVQDRTEIHEAASHWNIGLSRTCAPFRSCEQRFRTPSRRTGHAPFAMHPALQQTW